ncbi:hypothetical protein KPH14_003406 [Odynerus spinipes]|uniref:Uncharacterized protein n=1 Tax=Odynerus spinipes TaxID=1348599 RepID=A0AAD9RDD6_9HYME|nr:hypothetical protein KPH14_003406 [Odynerus spinipes]
MLFTAEQKFDEGEHLCPHRYFCTWQNCGKQKIWYRLYILTTTRTRRGNDRKRSMNLREDPRVIVVPF